MGKCKARGQDVDASNGLPIDCCDVVTPSEAFIPSESSHAPAQPQGAKSSKTNHLNLKVKEIAAVDANAKTTVDFVATTVKKIEQIAHQNILSLFTLKDMLVTCNIAHHWLLLR